MSSLKSWINGQSALLIPGNVHDSVHEKFPVKDSRLKYYANIRFCGRIIKFHSILECEVVETFYENSKVPISVSAFFNVILH